MTYRESAPRDLPRLELLADLCFGEGPDFRRLLLERRWRPGECFVAEDRTGRVVAMVFAFPFTFLLPGVEEAVPGAYVYSLGVSPGFRGQGIGGSLMDFLWETMQARGVPLMALVPAEASLFGYYEKLGFHPFAPIARGPVELSLLPREGASLAARPAGPEDVFRVREALLRDIPHGSWDRDALDYQKEFSKLSHGGLYLLGEGEGCAVVEVYDEKLHIKELLAPPALLPAALRGIGAAFPGWPIEARTRPDWGEGLSLPAERFAMARWAGEHPVREGYFALVLD